MLAVVTLTPARKQVLWALRMLPLGRPLLCRVSERGWLCEIDQHPFLYIMLNYHMPCSNFCVYVACRCCCRSGA